MLCKGMDGTHSHPSLYEEKWNFIFQRVSDYSVVGKTDVHISNESFTTWIADIEELKAREQATVCTITEKYIKENLAAMRIQLRNSPSY